MPIGFSMNVSRRSNPIAGPLSSAWALSAVLLAVGGAGALQVLRWGASAHQAVAISLAAGVTAVVAIGASSAYQAQRVSSRLALLLADSDDVVLLVHDGIVGATAGPIESVLRVSDETAIGLTLAEVLPSHDFDRVQAAFTHAVGQQDLPARVASLPLGPDGASSPDRFVDLIVRDRSADRSVRAFVVTVRDVTGRTTAERQLLEAAANDAQTQLPNRSRFLDLITAEIHRARRSGDHITVLSVGLDRHQTILEGFNESDVAEIMFEMGQRLRTAVRVEDAVGRTASDQFGVLLGGLTPAIGRAYAVDVADRIATLLHAPFHVSGSRVELNVSVGAAHRAQGTTDVPAHDLLRDAEESLRSVRANTDRWKDATETKTASS